MSSTTAIETRGLTKHFGQVRAVERLDLKVERGGTFGFLGPNGAGKTTTIRMLLDFVRPTRGEVEMLGGDAADPGVRRRIGYLPSDLHLPPGYTGEELFQYFGALRGRVEPSQVRRLVERFDLDPGRPIGELSTGNRRKVGIVQAFMHGPELLVLDEPTSGLDPLLQHEFYALLDEQAAAGKTVFLSSHVLPEVERVANRVAILRAGQLVSISRIDELQAQARQRIDLHVRGAVDPGLFECIPGVVEVALERGVVQLLVEGSVDAVVKAAASVEVTRIVTHDADLEEVFLGLYRAGGPS